MTFVRRIDTLLLTGVGVLVVHQVSYALNALTGSESSIAHGHLGPLWLVASIAAVAGLARSAVQSIQGRGLEISPVSLMIAIIGAYTVLESAERIAGGLGATTVFGEAVFWIGLVAAPLVACVLSAAVARLADAIAALVESPAPKPQSAAPSTTPRRLLSTPARLAGFGNSQSWRGPPVRIVF